MPVYQATPQGYAFPQARPSGQQPRRAAGNSIYLPPMPEMLRPANPAPSARHAQTETKPAAAPTAGKGAPAVVVRGQEDEELPRKPPVRLRAPVQVTIPPPEELGLLPAAPTASDKSTPSGDKSEWDMTRNRLDKLGATFYRIDKMSDGSIRLSCAVPYPQDPARQRQFEVYSSSEPEAFRLAVQQIEEWQVTQK